MTATSRPSPTTSASANGTDQATAARRDPAGQVCLGIDLGTTRTVVALADRGNYPVLSFTDTDGDAHPYLPSLTALTEDGLVHGFEAAAAAREGAPLLRSLKRTLSDPSVTWSTPVRLAGAGGAGEGLGVGEVLTSYLSALRHELQGCPELAGADLGSASSRVVVAVPAHAWGAQRMLTLDAFAAAGFHVTAMLNEPSAAGFEYTHRQGGTVTSRRTQVVVYDLGGGTFDTSLVDVAGAAHDVLASRGLPDLGGDDIDLVLARMALEAAGVGEESLSGVQSDDLLEQCRLAKESLAPQTRRIALEVAGQTVVLAAADLYARCSGLVERSLTLMEPLVARLEGAVGSAGTDPVHRLSPDVAGIYLVGGASAFPPVGRALRERYGRRVHRSPYPGSSTAIGLAIAADPDSGYALTDRLSRGFGVFRETAGGARTSFDPLLLPDAVQAPAVGQASATVIEREYHAVHDVARYRFVECEGIDERGEPTGRLAPAGQVCFPLEAGLRHLDDDALAQQPVHRLGHGPQVHERYEVDAAGRVSVTLTDLSDGYCRRYLLGQGAACAVQPPAA